MFLKMHNISQHLNILNILSFNIFNLIADELQKLSWSGLPKPVRPTSWKILSVSRLDDEP